jgi:nitrogen fixation protein NifU and related proteins
MSIDRQQSIRLLSEHYSHPRNRGPLPDADIVTTGGDPGCGHVITMYALVDSNGCIECAAFEGEGCTIALAAASYVTEMVQGMSLAAIDELSFEPLFDQLGRDILQTRAQCATLALGTLKLGVHALRMATP